MKHRLIIELDIEAEPALDDPIDIANDITGYDYKEVISAEWKLDDFGRPYNERE